MIKIKKSDKVDLEILDLKTAELLYDRILELINTAYEDAEMSYDLLAFNKASAKVVKIIDGLIKDESDKCNAKT